MKSAKDRFLEKIELIPFSTCHWWKAGASVYGMFWFDGKRQGAHRVSWSMHNGREVPEGSLVLHKCDNPLCVNPSHLFLGSQKDNMQDMVKKGRKAVRAGKDNFLTKLKDAEVIRIKGLLKEGKLTQKAIAAVFGCDQSTVCRINQGFTWRRSTSS